MFIWVVLKLGLFCIIISILIDLPPLAAGACNYSAQAPRGLEKLID